MPPRKAEKQLTAAERDVLTRWVKEGGKYTKHWAFVPPKKLQPDWAGNAVDALVGRQLNAQGVEFAPEADKATLARRVALVLTGLPPEPRLLGKFLSNKKPDAYERLVDALLARQRAVGAAGGGGAAPACRPASARHRSPQQRS